MVILVAALDYTIPMIRIVPVLLWTSPDGVTGAAVTPDSLPTDLSDASVKAWLWQYLMHRESYSWVEMDYNHYVVEAMSATPVRDAYDRWSSGRNADSYMRLAFVVQNKAQLRELYGQHGAADIFDNLGAEVVFGTGDLELAQELEKRLGDATVNVITQNRPRWFSWCSEDTGYGTDGPVAVTL